MAKTSPVYKKPKDITDKAPDYQVVLTFNCKAQLVDVAYPEMEPARIIEHLAVATQFMAQKAVK